MKFISRFSLYHLVIIFLLSLYILGSFKFGMQKVFWQLTPTLVAAVATDAILKYLKLKRWVISLSAIISGLIIGLTGQFGEKSYILVVMAVTAMVIKAFVRLDGRHIFNPAGSGLLIGLLFSSFPSWWVGGENFWIYLIWLPILLYRMKRWAPMVGFLLPLVILHGLNILTSSSILFFTSVMLIEPKTSPATVKLGLVYGLVVSVGYLIIGRFFQFDPFVSSLLIGNLTQRILARYSNI
ncbi:RnfABCDGE type electron transport complex subunit D [Candidatus Microgenomates bacterium]|nr:RnfABCDGE type electron transport complex subunit D [Candidatus Microgenomates bacterium]